MGLFYESICNPGRYCTRHWFCSDNISEMNDPLYSNAECEKHEPGTPNTPRTGILAESAVARYDDGEDEGGRDDCGTEDAFDHRCGRQREKVNGRWLFYESICNPGRYCTRHWFCSDNISEMNDPLYSNAECEKHEPGTPNTPRTGILAESAVGKIENPSTWSSYFMVFAFLIASAAIGYSVGRMKTKYGSSTIYDDPKYVELVQPTYQSHE